MKRKILWSALAALPLLVAGASLGLYHAAKAATRANTPAEALDCCLDPTCPPGCSEECPPTCLSTTGVKTPAMTTGTTGCCSEGSDSCPEETCCPSASVKSSGRTTPKKYICPPCPLCPGW